MSESIEDQLREHPCPGCGHRTLELQLKLVSRPIGTWSLAGQQPKTSAVEWPYLVCTTEHCGFETAAKRN